MRCSSPSSHCRWPGDFLQARGIDNPLDSSALARIWLGMVDSAVRWWLDHPDESAQAMIDRCARLLGAIADDAPKWG